tara:strand:- start:398 stop:607 length:210 start_codon:yes stop_codon:yes gene_type:complete
MTRKLKNIRDFKIKKTPASVFPYETKMQSDMDKKDKKKTGGVKKKKVVAKKLYKSGGFIEDPITNIDNI